MDGNKIDENIEEQLKDVSGGALIQTSTDNSIDNSIHNSFNHHRINKITVQGDGNRQLIGSIDLSSGGGGGSGGDQQTKIPLSLLENFFND